MWQYNYSSDLYLDELMHYGVLGMKWGVRRTPEQLGRKTIKAGTKMYRVSTDSKGTGPTGKPTYVTYTKVDRDMYKGPMNNTIKDNNSKSVSDKTYETQYKLNKDLTIPSLKEVREIQNKFNKNMKTISEIGRTQTITTLNQDYKISKKEIDDIEKVYRGKLKPKDTDLAKIYGAKGKKYIEDATELYKEILLIETKKAKNSKGEDYNYKYEWSLGASGSNKNQLISELKKRGYNSIYDNASIGISTKHREGYEPLIIFDDSVLTEVKRKEVTPRQSYKSNKRYMDWYKKINSSTN